MKVLTYPPNESGIADIKVIYPDEWVPIDLASEANDVELIEDLQSLFGKTGVAKYNAVTKTVFYEYIDRPLNQEEIIQQLQADNETLKLMVADLGLMVGGGL